MPITRERTTSEDVIRLPPDGSFVVQDEQGNELLKMSAG